MPGRGLPLGGRRNSVYWSEEGCERTALLSLVVGYLNEHGWGKTIDSGWEDWDLEVYGIQPAKLREILDQFGEVQVVGETFAVYKLGKDLDVSIPRRERKIGKGHRGVLGRMAGCTGQEKT